MTTETAAGTPARTLRERIAALRESPAFRNYEHVRDRVLAMKAVVEASPEYRPSAYWQEELANFEYMFDATPLIVDRLRHHTYHITGVWIHDYRTHRVQGRRFEKKLRALAAQGSMDLFVPEWRPLGGYGFDIDGQLVNIDTLKYFEVLTALQKGSVLQEFRDNTERRLVWEIGAGWGGFPYAFKTLCPNVTYLITDLPELFLFSATYLMTAFPGAKVAFWGDLPADRLFATWRDYDFIFAPHTALDQLTPDRLDLTVNMVSFQEMTQQQVVGYVSRAQALNCKLLYSLNRDRSPYNPEIENVGAIIDRYYWPHEIAVLPVPYTKMLDDEPPQKTYRHIVGWRRAKI